MIGAGVDECQYSQMQLEIFAGLGLYLGRGKRINMHATKLHAQNPEASFLPEGFSHVSAIISASVSFESVGMNEPRPSKTALLILSVTGRGRNVMRYGFPAIATRPPLDTMR
jgi:hypothetical protein